MKDFVKKVEEIVFLRKSALVIADCCKIVFENKKIELTLPIYQSWEILKFNYHTINSK